jgi:Tol biopolymer transport system component
MRLTVGTGALLCLLALVSAPAAGSASSAAGTSFNAGIVWAGDGIFTANVDGSGVRRLVPRLADQHFPPAWSRSGRALVFSARNSDSVTVYILRPPRETPEVLALKGRWTSPKARNFSYLLDPAWAPDERHIAFGDFWSPEYSTIRIASLGTRTLRSLTKPRTGRTDDWPAWSPRGRTIAFVRRTGSRAPRILLVGRDGRGLYRLTRGESPSWSPDGRHLVYALGNSIFRIHVASRSRTRIVANLGERGAGLQPRWSPDGRKILYVTSGGIWTMDADGSDRVLVIRRSSRKPFPWVISGADWRPG